MLLCTRTRPSPRPRQKITGRAAPKPTRSRCRRAAHPATRTRAKPARSPSMTPTSPDTLTVNVAEQRARPRGRPLVRAGRAPGRIDPWLGAGCQARPRLCGADLTWPGEVRVDACGPGREASPLRRPAVGGSVPSATVRDPAPGPAGLSLRGGGQIPGINLPGRVKKGHENRISVVSAVAVAAGPTPSCQFVPYPA